MEERGSLPRLALGLVNGEEERRCLNCANPFEYEGNYSTDGELSPQETKIRLFSKLSYEFVRCRDFLLWEASFMFVWLGTLFGAPRCLIT